MINFTVGPVQSNASVLEIGAQQVPYFRTPEFSQVMLQNERLMLEFSGAPEGSRSVFITGSGTASMEAVVMNLLDSGDKALVVDGGSFGRRFCQLCEIHGVPFDRVVPSPGRSVTADDLKCFDGVGGYTAFIVNIHETSTGVRYDLDLIGDFCRRNGLFLIVDAISSFLADEIDMEYSGIDVLVVGSQKALACPPGISIVVLSPEALKRVERIPSKCMYLDLKDALKNGERGQTPFTPAVSVLLQINARLREIKANGGVDYEVSKTKALAEDFRKNISDLPFEMVSQSMSNAVTPLHPTTAKASEVFSILKDEYGIWICPNGGEYAEYMFRVGHIGALTEKDNDALISALLDMQCRGLI